MSSENLETREKIMRATWKLLEESGGSGVRMSDIAKAAGISRQAVLHHFGSRDGLMRATVGRAWAELFAELRGLGEGERPSLAAALERVDEVARRRGNARVGAWLLLSGAQLPPEAIEGQLAALPGQLVEARGAEPGAPGGVADPRDAHYTTLLVAAALFGDAIFGGRFREVFGMEDSEAARADFRAWLAARLGPSCP